LWSASFFSPSPWRQIIARKNWSGVTACPSDEMITTERTEYTERRPEVDKASATSVISVGRKRGRARQRIAQTASFWLFRLATYAILAAATYIFLDIGVKGSRTLFTTHAPFINVSFLTQRPQTLYVFEFEGKKYTLSDSEFRVWKTQHPEEVDATSVAYSAGGVWPCIVGTALLVIGSMIFALAVGICSAIYLSEYSQNTTFIRLTRVAILNLAGVPSIV